MRIDNTPTDNWLCGIVIIIAVIFSHHPYASDQKPSALAGNLHKVRTECWQHVRSSNHALIECENVALEGLIVGRVAASQKVILHDFLNRRLEIADQLDHKEISSDEYRTKLFDATADFEKKINGLST